MPNALNNSSEKAENNTTNKEKNCAEGSFVNDLRSEIDELSVEVKTSVADLKKSIADIRVTLSDVENPFNVLRGVSSEKDIENLKSQNLPSGIKSIVLGDEENLQSEDSSLKPSSEIEQMKETSTENSNRKKESSKSEPIKATDYISWIWDLLDAGLASEDVKQLAGSCELMNFTPPQSSEIIYSLAKCAEKFKALGLSKGQLLLFLYKAAAMSKSEIDREDMETLVAVTEQQLRPQRTRGTS